MQKVVVCFLLCLTSTNGFLGGGCGGLPPPAPLFPQPCPPVIQQPCPQPLQPFPPPTPLLPQPIQQPCPPVIQQPCPQPFGPFPPPPPPPFPPPPQPCPPNPIYFPPPQQPCPPQPIPPPFQQPPYPCPPPNYASQYSPYNQYSQYLQYPRPFLPPLIKPPKVYPEIPEEYLRGNEKLIGETINKKNLPDPFDDLKRPIPVPFVPDRRPVGGCGFEGPPVSPYAVPPYAPYYRYQQQQQLLKQQYPQYLPPRPPFPAPPTYPTPMVCCTRCYPCRTTNRLHGGKIANETIPDPIPENDNNLNDSKELSCNDQQLKTIMLQFISLPLKEAKVMIHETAEKELGPNFHVICSETDFEYVTRSLSFCQVEMDKGICYAFRTG